MRSKHLTLIVGPTAVGKTAYAVRLARERGTEIVSCDSRQVYSELNIGVARPSPEELQAARHHLVACRSVQEPYNAYDFGQEALRIVKALHQSHDEVIAVGGSGLYIQALLGGVPPLPDPIPELRASLQRQLRDEGIESLRSQLRLLDPEYYSTVDLANPARLQRALEVCLTTGRPYSSFIAKDKSATALDFETTIIELRRERDDLRRRIDWRTDKMMSDGLLDEATSLLPYRNLQPLNTVGYKELFDYIDGRISLDEAVQQIKNHTWQYAKKQTTWLRKGVNFVGVNFQWELLKGS